MQRGHGKEYQLSDESILLRFIFQGMEFVHPSQYDSSEVLSLGIEMQMFISLQLKDFALFDKQDTKNSSLIIEKMIASYLMLY